jgi:hypothetical protein
MKYPPNLYWQLEFDEVYIPSLQIYNLYHTLSGIILYSFDFSAELVR